MLICKYTPPTGTNAPAIDVTDYVARYTWSGDADQAARKLDFDIAYNSPVKDAGFVNLDLQLGGSIALSYIDDAGNAAEIFNGRIFWRKRNTGGYTMGFTAYDNMIYLAKNKVHMVFNNLAASAVIRQVCNEIGIPYANNNPDLPTVINYIADGKSCTEVIRMALDKVEADTGKSYSAVSINGEITIVQHGTVVENYLASDLTNVIESEHSEGYENMVNRVKLVDEHGNLVKTITATEYQERYGTLQDVYKMQPPKEGESVDNLKAAKYRLKFLDNDSRVKALGNIQCITGYAINIMEEQLQGTFLIKSDTHTFEGNQHTMDLVLSYMFGTAKPTLSYS
ncbi:XkdQ/YqbQ family protein [Phascolarctobacterium succinatutens]|uniref:XkdQ/YqbQ family protein n=1 Tax=Phascolarctobacterium succinatutens TaxID=626940 RepID=UPI00266F9FE1|nr:hypothetical protein [Phascolarctobacterium succinatutens]